MSEDLFRVQESGERRLKLQRSKQRQWVEDGFWSPDIKDEHSIQYSQTDGYVGTILSNRRLSFLIAVLAGFFLILFARAFYLQIVRGPDYLASADANRLRFESITSDRGLIYDRYFTPLVRNIPNYVALVTPSQLPDGAAQRQEFLRDLYQRHFVNYTDQNFDDFFRGIEDNLANPATRDKEQVIARHLRQDDAILLQVDANRVKGIRIEYVTRRDYLNEGPIAGRAEDTNVYPPVKSLSHLLGYITSLHPGEYEALKNDGYIYNDFIGRTGLEAAYEERLRGTFGRREIEVDAQGNLKQILTQQPPSDGLSLLTSLDLELQRAAESILTDYLHKEKRARGTVIAADPQSGEILAMVNLPTYDNNLFARGISQKEYQALTEDPNQPLFSRAIAGEYPSGSTFKPIVAAAGLAEGVITPRTTLTSLGGIRINQWFFPDWKSGGHGATNVYKALGESVNTYFYIIGGGYQEREGLGVARITDYAHKFGFDKTLGIDLPQEASGFLPSKEWKESEKGERWYIGDTYHLAIGQGDLLVTPLQITMMMASFANGGTLHQPHLVTSYVDKDQNVVEVINPQVLEPQVVDEEAILVVQQGLRQVVTTGSGRKLSDLPMTAAGKTGTAQWHSSKDPHAWFTGYAPFNQPRIVITVLVEEGKEGSGIATDVARDILLWWYENRLKS